MAYKVVPEDFINRLTRINAELARRNGYPDLSSYANQTFPAGTPITVGTLVTAPVFNTLLRSIEYINDEGLPDDAVGGSTYINESDISVLDNILTVLESQPRDAVVNSDCASLCAGMCVSECTTTCSSTCTSACGELCEGTCTTTCTGTCSGTCTLTCTGGCSGTCTGGCSGCTATCADNCTGNCSGGCYGSCYSTCTGTCSSTCARTCGGCSSSCTAICAGANE